MPSRRMTDDRRALLARRLDERVAELVASGPGEVRCGRLHAIDDIRTLRACDEALTDDERVWIQHQRERCEAALFGVQLSGPSSVSIRPRSTDEPDHWLHLLMLASTRPLRTLQMRLKLGRYAEPASTQTDALVEEAERAPLPAPKDLLDAAETWLTAGLVEGRTPRSLSPLREPWESAHVVELEH